MSKYIFPILFTLFIITCVRSHGVWETPSDLQPVHGLYVKPSIDGTTGDLYVAATEENGLSSQWLTDQPINFLAANTQSQPTTVPVSFTSTVTTGSSPQEETITTKKRAVITTPTIKYAYAVPTTGTEGSAVMPYPYTAPTSGTSEESKATPCANTAPYYSPFHYFYPQMMSAIAHAFNTYKDPSNTEEGTTSTQAQPITTWPHTYAYPYQYVMVDPNFWANQISTTTPTSKTSGKDAS